MLLLLPLPVVVVVMVVESALPQMLQLHSQVFHLASNLASLLVLSQLPSNRFLCLANLWDLKSANRIWLQPIGSSSSSLSLGSSLPTPSLFLQSTKYPCSVSTLPMGSWVSGLLWLPLPAPLFSSLLWI